MNVVFVKLKSCRIVLILLDVPWRSSTPNIDIFHFFNILLLIIKCVNCLQLDIEIINS